MSLSHEDAAILANTIKAVLLRSIEQGGTTLRDFLQSDGKPGYFAQELQVYGRARALQAMWHTDCQWQAWATQHLLVPQLSTLRQFCQQSLWTGAGRKAETSPPCRATSFTRVEEIKEKFSDGIKNTLSSVGSKCRFIRASCVSYSKSDTARNPRTRMFAC